MAAALVRKPNANNDNLVKGANNVVVAKPAPVSAPLVRKVATPVYTAPVRKVSTPTYSAPKSSSSSSSSRSSSSSSSSGGGGGGSSYSGGGGGGSFDGGGGGAVAAAPAPVMQQITIPDAEADEYYKKTVGDLARALTDFKAQQGLARSQYDFGWNDAKRRMGWDNTAKSFKRENPGAYGESVSANENDFAGRGMLKSGAYIGALADIDRDFNDRRTALDTAQSDNVNTQNQALSTFQGSQDSTKSAAMSDAVARIASKYGIDLSEVPKGTTKTIERQVV